MSSGSSGKSVIVPEPSRSMFCFMRRMSSRDCVTLLCSYPCGFDGLSKAFRGVKSYLTELSSVCEWNRKRHWSKSVVG